MQMLAAALAEIAGQQPEHLVEVGDQRAVGCLLDAEILEDGDAAGGRDPACGGAQQVLVDPAAVGVVTDRDGLEDRAHLLDAVGVLGEKGFVAEVFLHQHAGQCGQAPGVGAGFDL